MPPQLLQYAWNIASQRRRYRDAERFFVVGKDQAPAIEYASALWQHHLKARAVFVGKWTVPPFVEHLELEEAPRERTEAEHLPAANKKCAARKFAFGFPLLAVVIEHDLGSTHETWVAGCGFAAVEQVEQRQNQDGASAR